MNPQSKKFLPYGRQVIEQDDIDAVTATLQGDWLTTGPAVDDFEDYLAELTGARHAVVCSSGTAALHLAALALGLNEKDQVVVPSMTFLATSNAVRYVGAEVLFSDVDPDSGLIGPDHLLAALDAVPENATVSAVFPVHLNGQTVDLKEIRRVAEQQNLAVVEDASHALGTIYNDAEQSGLRVGGCQHSDMTVFSFHPVKTIAMGEGGAITTNDDELAKQLSNLRSHGIVRNAEKFEIKSAAFDTAGEPNPWYHEMPDIGFNYRASDVHCALGLSQLRKLDRFVTARRALAARYDEQLPALAPLVQPVRHVPNCGPAWHLYAVLIDYERTGRDRATVMRRMAEQGVGTQVHYIPVHSQPYYRRRYGEQTLPGAQRYYDRVLSLPLHVNMGNDEVDRVVATLGDILVTA